jgi:hypothetical protein
VCADGGGGAHLDSGDRNGERYDSTAAMVRHSSHTPKMAPSRISLPMRTSTGSNERCTPSGVRLSEPSASTLSSVKSRILK